MLKVVYCDDGYAISDFKVQDYVSKILDEFWVCRHNEMAVRISNELCLMVFGLWTLERKFPLDEIEFYFENEKLEFDPVLGFMDLPGKKVGFYSDITEQALQVSYKKMMDLRKRK